MSTQHRATEEQWASINDPENPFPYESCILELRDRLTALEASTDAAPERDSLVERVAESMATPEQSSVVEPAPAGGLVERVCANLEREYPHVIPRNWSPEARATPKQRERMCKAATEGARQTLRR